MNEPEHLDDCLSHLRARHDLLGMSVVAVRDRHVCYARGFGWADISRHIPVGDETLYRVASASKSITATAVMLLCDRGLLHLEDDIGGHLGYAVRNPRHPGTPITIRMLLSHTSSLADGPSYDAFLSASYHADPPPALAELFAEPGRGGAGGLFRDYAPGSRFEYANLNYGILGTLLEAAANMRFDHFCRQHLFLPLGMNATFQIQDVANIDTVAVLYRKHDGAWMPQWDDFQGVPPPVRDLSRYRPGTNALVFSPHGGLRASANGLATFMRMHLNDGAWNDVSILKPETARHMRCAQCMCEGAGGIAFRWGLGFHLPLSQDTAFFDGPVAGHSGEAYGLMSAMYFNAANGTGIVFITNGCGAGFHRPAGSVFSSIESDVFKTVYAFIKAG